VHEAIRRVAELAAAAAPAHPRPHLRLSGDPAADEAAVAAAAAFPGFTYEGDPEGFVTPELQASRTFQARARVLGAAPERLRAALEGAYPGARRLAAHALDVLWQHPDDPSAHSDWLTGVLGADSALFAFGGAAGASPGALFAFGGAAGAPPGAPFAVGGAAGAPPAPLRAVHAVTVADDGATWRVEGETWHVRPYRDAPAGEPLRPLVLTVAERADLEALLADADAAHAAGVVGATLAHPAVTVADLAPWAGPGEDPAPRLARLLVGADGLVRPAPAAPALGELGEPFATLRARAAERLAALDAELPPGAWPCLSLPEWLDPAELAEIQAARPWLPAWALVPRALRALARRSGPVRAEVRVAGLGGPLHYDGERDPARSTRRLLLRAGDRHAIYDPRTDTALGVGADLAAIWEGLAACGDPAAVAAWLAGARRLAAPAAQRAVTVAVGRLQAAGMLDTDDVHAAEPVGVPA
jgi:hypothetical protein